MFECVCSICMGLAAPLITEVFSKLWILKHFYLKDTGQCADLSNWQQNKNCKTDPKCYLHPIISLIHRV